VTEAAPGHVQEVRRLVFDPLTKTQSRQLREIGRRIIRAIDPRDHRPDDHRPDEQPLPAAGPRRHLMTGILSPAVPAACSEDEKRSGGREQLLPDPRRYYTRIGGMCWPRPATGRDRRAGMADGIVTERPESVLHCFSEELRWCQQVVGSEQNGVLDAHGLARSSR